MKVKTQHEITIDTIRNKTCILEKKTVIGHKSASTGSLFFFSQTVAAAMLGLLQPFIRPSKYLCDFNRRRMLLRTIPRAFPRDARHQNRFHIRRTKKGDIKGDGNREWDGIAQGVPETWRRTARSSDSHMHVYIIHTREA